MTANMNEENWMTTSLNAPKQKPTGHCIFQPRSNRERELPEELNEHFSWPFELLNLGEWLANQRRQVVDRANEAGHEDPPVLGLEILVTEEDYFDLMWSSQSSASSRSVLLEETFRWLDSRRPLGFLLLQERRARLWRARKVFVTKLSIVPKNFWPRPVVPEFTVTFRQVFLKQTATWAWPTDLYGCLDLLMLFSQFFIRLRHKAVRPGDKDAEEESGIFGKFALDESIRQRPYQPLRIGKGWSAVRETRSRDGQLLTWQRGQRASIERSRRPLEDKGTACYSRLRPLFW